MFPTKCLHKTPRNMCPLDLSDLSQSFNNHSTKLESAKQDSTELNHHFPQHLFSDLCSRWVLQSWVSKNCDVYSTAIEWIYRRPLATKWTPVPQMDTYYTCREVQFWSFKIIITGSGSILHLQAKIYVALQGFLQSQPFNEKSLLQQSW